MFQLTDVIEDWLAGRTSHGFAVQGGTNDGGLFSNMRHYDARKRPLLVFNYTVARHAFAGIRMAGDLTAAPPNTLEV